MKILMPLANNNIFIFNALDRKRKRDWLIGNAPVVKSRWFAKKSFVQLPIFFEDNLRTFLRIVLFLLIIDRNSF